MTLREYVMHVCFRLLDDFRNGAGTNGTAAFTDRELRAVLKSDRGEQLNIHDDVVARHAHLSAFRQSDDASNVSRTKVELDDSWRRTVYDDRLLPSSERKPEP